MGDVVPVLGGDDTKKAPHGDIFDQPPGEMSSIRGKLADHVEDHAVLSPEGAVLVTSLGTELSYPRPPQSLKDSLYRCRKREYPTVKKHCFRSMRELLQRAQLDARLSALYLARMFRVTD